MAATRTLTSISTGEWVSKNPVETFNLGALIGEQLQGGEVLLLSGPLGAGKTIFVKGLASSLGLDPEEITSPSLTLVNPTRTRLPVYHADL
jgi:tRNA threonylcarbamoyladenosine biosynthesis protein TsaE